MKTIDEIRIKINETDKELCRLLEARMELCGSVGEYKKTNGMKIFDACREEQVIAAVYDAVKNPRLKPYVAEDFREIMRISRKYQQDIIGDKHE